VSQSGQFGPLAGDDAGDDFDEYVAWLDREEAAGRSPLPPEAFPPDQFPPDPTFEPDDTGWRVEPGDPEGAISADDADWAYESDAADGGHEPASREWTSGSGAIGGAFEQGGPADVLTPGPMLGELTEVGVAALPGLTDDELIGVLLASRRQQNREDWKQALMVAEFARRRTAQLQEAEEWGAPVHRRPGQFPGEELAIELVLGPIQTSHVIDDSTDLVTRLPATLAGMAAGLIDAGRAGIIAVHTRLLSPDAAAAADRILAALAPSLRPDQLLRKAAALEMKLAPEAVRARRDRARRTLQRVEVRREESGNASVAARELDTTDALASKAHIHALASRLRQAGLPGTLDQLRVLVFTDLTAGRDPMDRIGGRDPMKRAGGGLTPDPARDRPNGDPPGADPSDLGPSNGGPSNGGPSNACPAGDDRSGEGTLGAPGGSPGTAADANPAGPAAGPAGDGPGAGRADPASANTSDRAPAVAASLDYDHDEDGEDADPGSAGSDQPPGPVPATINLIVPAGTLFGWDSSPTEAGGWGLLDGDETQALVTAASRHPATRWCVTVTGEGGAAVAHGCAPGRHAWPPPPGPSERDGSGPPADRRATFLRGLNLTLRPVAGGSCDHTGAEPRYTPSRTLAHLVRARTATCDAPGCPAQAVHADLDHTVPYPAGPTDQCNLGPKCRRHHRVKQAPGWQVEQPRPGVIRWTLPSGRTHVTRPTGYELMATS
jgi:hypothetical protein